MGMHIHEGERRLKDPSEKLFADPAQGETGQGDAELGRRQVGVEMYAYVLGENGADVAFVLKRIELAGPHFYDREFGRDEKGVERDEPDDQGDLADENDWRVPVFSYCFGQGSGR